MTFTDTLQLALRNLNQAKLRTALTTMGVSIGIASLAGMVSLGVGLQDAVVGRLTKSGMFDSITVMQQQNLRGLFGRGGGGRGGGFGGGRGGARATAAPAAPEKALDDDAMRELRALPEVKDVYPSIRVPVQVKFEHFDGGNLASGVPMSAKDEGAFQTFTAGAFFSNDSDNACLLSLDFAKQLTDSDPKALIGQVLTLAYAASSPAATDAPATPGGGIRRVETTFTIMGIVEREQGPGAAGIGFSGVMIPLGVAMKINAGTPTGRQNLLAAPADAAATPPKRSYGSLTVKVTRAQATQDVEDKIKAMGYGAFSLNDALKTAKTAFILLDIVLSLIGSIALAVSSLGIVNTMVMSILERTREIGIMKAIGGSDGDIRRIFLIEASAIGLLGGVAGVVLGWIVGRGINFGANIYIRQQGGIPGNLFSMPFWLIGGAIGFSIFVSLLAGSYPASRAAKLDPIQALRHD